MNPLLVSFKQNMWLAAQQGGLRKGELIEKHDINHFELDEINDTDSARDIAAKALCYFCVEGGRFNCFTVGIAAVLGFLERHCRSVKPITLEHRGLFYRDLKDVLNKGGRHEDILTLINIWFA
jgi:hypothetical protein